MSNGSDMWTPPGAKPMNLATLNRLFAVLYRSLPMYLAGATPWTREGNHRGQQAHATLERIVADQREMAGRVADLISRRRGRVDRREFPTDFAELNYLSLEFLLKELAESARRDIASLEKCVVDVEDDPQARALAEEALGAERAHLEMLERALPVSA